MQSPLFFFEKRYYNERQEDRVYENVSCLIYYGNTD